jgi:hypothetical protein
VAVYGGTTTIHIGDGRENFVLLPIIEDKTQPARKKAQTGKAKKKSR